MTAADRLAEIQDRTDAATDGPWEYRYLSPYKGGNVYEPSGYPLPGCTNCGDNEATYEEYDAEFIAHARTDVPRLVAAVRAVLDLHKREWWSEGSFNEGVACEACSAPNGTYMDYPCPTVRAVEAALGEVAS